MMRALCVVALFAVIASAAGGYSTCPTATQKDYSNVTGCTDVGTCASKYCTCVGGTVVSGVCNKKDATCQKGYDCSLDFLDCMEGLARSVTNTSTCYGPLKTLHENLLLFSTGMAIWNTSKTYDACKYAICMFYNETTTGTCNTTNDYIAACWDPPVEYQGQVTIGGNWSAIFANATALAEAKKCLQVDLQNHLRYPVAVLSVTKAANDEAVVVYVVDAAKATVDSEITSASGNTNWLKCMSAAKFAQLGGTGTLTTKFADTATPTPSGTTPAPTGTPAPTSGATPPPASASMMWSAVQVLVAVVAVLVVA